MTEFSAGVIGGRVLGVAYLAAAIVALTMTLFFGFFVAPFLLVGVAWLAAVGGKLIAGSPRAATQARRTVPFAVPVAVLMGVYGVYALRAAARSADEGGGLVGAFGAVPVILAITLAAVSVLTLARTRRDEKSLIE